jgi:Sigma-70 region 2
LKTNSIRENENFINGKNKFMPDTETIDKPETCDLTLARLCAAGDRCAQTELYEKFQRKIKATCSRITRNADAAEDLTQDIFIQIFRTIGGFKGEACHMDSPSRRQPGADVSEEKPARVCIRIN